MKKIKEMLVFVVEDEPMYRRLVENSLSKNGFSNIKTFSSGEECLLNLSLTPDIVLLDYRLGGIDGIDVLKRIKKDSPKSKVIFLSGQETVEIVIKALKLGAADFILKNNMSLEKLKQSITHMVNRDTARFNKKVYWNLAKITVAFTIIAFVILLTLNALYPGLMDN